MKGYKGFESDFRCLKHQYAVGETYEFVGKIELCEAGFHFSSFPVDCLTYYPLGNSYRYAEVEALGEIKRDFDKSVTSKIKIIREIPMDEWLKLCTGKFFNCDNEKIRTRNYIQGKLNGLYEYIDNKMKIRCHMKDNILHGLYEEWFSDGQILCSENYKNGLPDGLFQSWYPEGQIAYRKNYKNGELNGLFESWYNPNDKSDQLYERIIYEEGNEVSYECWHPDGSIANIFK